MKKIIFRYSRRDRNGKIHYARKGHPFPIEVDDEKGSVKTEP